MARTVRTVFILGAGASADAGVPQMHNFLERAMLLEPPAGEVASAFELVRKARGRLALAQSKAQFNIRNVEEVFAAFEMADLFGRLGDLPKDEVPRLVPSMRTVIVHTVEHHMVVGVRDGVIHGPQGYDRFGALLTLLRKNGHFVSVLTFNYDIGIDMGLLLSDIDVDYCLREATGPDGDAVELMKLHGSIYWAVCSTPGCRPAIPLSVQQIVEGLERKWRRESTTPRPEIRLNEARHLALIECDMCKAQCRSEPMIVPPTASKAGLHMELRTVWERAARRLSEADNIFIIGYSWPAGDHFFQQLYALGTIGDTILSRLWVINPDADVRAKIRKRLLGQQAQDCFWPTDGESAFTFGASIDRIAAEFDLGRIETPVRPGRIRDPGKWG